MRVVLDYRYEELLRYVVVCVIALGIARSKFGFLELVHDAIYLVLSRT